MEGLETRDTYFSFGANGSLSILGSGGEAKKKEYPLEEQKIRWYTIRRFLETGIMHQKTDPEFTVILTKLLSKCPDIEDATWLSSILSMKTLVVDGVCQLVFIVNAQATVDQSPRAEYWAIITAYGDHSTELVKGIIDDWFKCDYLPARVQAFCRDLTKVPPPDVAADTLYRLQRLTYDTDPSIDACIELVRLGEPAMVRELCKRGNDMTWNQLVAFAHCVSDLSCLFPDLIGVLAKALPGMARPLRVHTHRTIESILGYGVWRHWSGCDKRKNPHRWVCMQEYMENHKLAVAAINAWTLVARRLGVVKDMRVLVSKLIWKERHLFSETMNLGLAFKQKEIPSWAKKLK